jgi:hypothetical protein
MENDDEENNIPGGRGGMLVVPKKGNHHGLKYSSPRRRFPPEGSVSAFLAAWAHRPLLLQLRAPFGTAANRRSGPILLQKSPRRSCGIKMRNNRIGVTDF